MFKTLSTAAAALTMIGALAASPADARLFHRAQTCRTAGTVTGAVIGGVLGNAITGHSAVGTVAGAGIGGVAGHSIAQGNCHNDRNYSSHPGRRGYYSYYHGRRYYHRYG